MDGRYEQGTPVHLSAAANNGYKFDGWSDDFSSTSNVIKLTMDSDKAIRAAFSKTTFALSLDTTEGGTVSFSPQAKSFDPGSSVVLKATPSKAFVFKSWTGDASGNENPLTLTMDRDRKIGAEFAAAEYSLTVKANPVGFVDIRPASTSYRVGTVVTLSAIAPPNYRFVSWSGAATGSTLVIPVTMDSDKSVTANFVRTHTLVTIVSPPGSGSVSPASGSYDENSVVVLTATPASGYFFVGWTGNVTGTVSPVTIMVNWGQVAQANFAPFGGS